MRFVFFSPCNFRCWVLLELRWQLRLHTPPVCALLKLWEIDGTHPPKSSSHEGARNWQIHCFPVLCSQTPCTTHQLCGAIDRALWLGFTPCRAMTITQTLQQNYCHPNLAYNPCKEIFPSVQTHLLPKHILWLPESKIANHPEERYSIIKIRQACNIPGMIPLFTWVLHLLTAVK